MSERFAWAFLTGVILMSFIPASLTSAQEQEVGNSKCYVCHPYLKTETLTTDHLEMGITCDMCHGPTIEHMHDEMLMTAPDQLFGREEVRAFCSTKDCHAPANDRAYYTFKDHKEPAKVLAFSEEWHGRMRPNGRAVTDHSVCTDCHGTHNLDKPVGTAAEEEDPADWITAFNGKDLSGWKATGGAKWTIQNGRIEAVLADDAKAGDLWTTTPYKDYQLAVTFRAEWPIKAGIWTRGKLPETNKDKADAVARVTGRTVDPGAGNTNNPEQFGPRIEIADYDHPVAHTGSIHVPGKGLAVLNFRPDLVDKEAWNTIAVKAEGNHVQVWLNGEEIGAITAPGPENGSIGFHLERDGAKAGKLVIREVLIQLIEKRPEQ